MYTVPVLSSVFVDCVFFGFCVACCCFFCVFSGVCVALSVIVVVGSNVGAGVAGSGVYAVGELTGDCVNDGSLSTLYEQPASPQKVNTAKNSAKSFFFSVSPPQYIYFHDALQKIRLFPKVEENRRIPLDFQISSKI